MHYKNIRAVDRLFKDMIIVMLFIFVQYLMKISRILLDIAAEQGIFISHTCEKLQYILLTTEL